MEPATICHLTKLCMTSTYFLVEHDVYEQTYGAPMGSPLSPVLADLYMEFFEKMAINSAQYKPTLWLRCVDDTFVLWPHGKEKLMEFHKHINSLRESIQFTIETEEGGKLPFLDVNISRQHQQLNTTVYRKPTHTNRYLNFKSNHHPRTKLGIIKCLAHRAKNICKGTQVLEEFNNLQEAFQSMISHIY